MMLFHLGYALPDRESDAANEYEDIKAIPPKALFPPFIYYPCIQIRCVVVSSGLLLRIISIKCFLIIKTDKECLKLTRLAIAPATAKSGFPLTLLMPCVCTLGSALPLAAAELLTAVPVMVLLMPMAEFPCCRLVTADCLLLCDAVAAALLGDAVLLKAAASRLRFIALAVLEALTLIAVAGGSGRGRMPPVVEGVWMLVRRLAGELVVEVAWDWATVLDAACCWGGAKEREAGLKVLVMVLAPVMNSWWMASSGLSLRSGSQRRHLVMKSRKVSSSHFRACCRVLELGRRRLPMEETVRRGFPKESKKSFFRVDFWMRFL